MSRARELAKMGGSTQVISGVSTFVGIATFASDVDMFSNLSVTGDLNVTGDLSYDETTATNSRITGVSTTKDLVVTQNADVAGIVSATTFEGTLATTNLSGTITNDQLAGSIANAKLASPSATIGGVTITLGDTDATPAFDLTDATGLPISSGVSGLGANVAGFLATPSSANLISAVTDETGSGSLVFGTSPTIATPTITGRASLADVVLSGGLQVGAALTVTGDLFVNGTTTTINSTTLTVDDKNIELGSVDTPSDTTANGGGITLKGASDHTLIWYNDNDHWESSEHFNLVSGKSYQIADASVLSATTLGAGVTSSSLTSVGTITSGVWNGTAIANANLANSTISGTSLGSNLPTATFATSGTGLSGSATYNGTGTATFTVTSNATNANTASTIVARDASGNFSAGTITASLTGNVTGNCTGSSGSCTGNSATATTATNLSGGSVAATTGTFSGNVDIGNATSDTLTITARVDSDIVPSTNNARALGTTSLRWSNIYSNDLDLSNEGSVNDFDGTWGSYLIQEGEEDLFILNRRNGKKYKFVLQEV